MTALRTSAVIGASSALAGVLACSLAVHRPAPVAPSDPGPVAAEPIETAPPVDDPPPALPPIRIVPAKDGGLTCFAPRDLALLRARLAHCSEGR